LNLIEEGWGGRELSEFRIESTAFKSFNFANLKVSIFKKTNQSTDKPFLTKKPRTLILLQGGSAADDLVFSSQGVVL